MSTTTGFRGSPADSGSAGSEAGHGVKNRRRRVRRELTFALLYADFGANNTGVVLNLSEDGFCVLATMPVEAEGSFVVRFRGGRDGGRMEVRGQVVWKSANKKRAGIQFIAVSQPALKQIRRWLSLTPAPKLVPSRPGGLVRNTPSEMTELAPPAVEHTSQPSQDSGSYDFEESHSNDGGMLADFSPSLGAFAGLTIILLSLLTFGLIRLSRAENSSAESRDAAILNTVPATDDQARAPSPPARPQSPPPRGAKSDDSDFPRQASAAQAQPIERSAAHILASPALRADAPDQQSLVRPDHEKDAAPVQQPANTKNADLARPPESVSPTQTETASRGEGSPPSPAPPVQNSLTSAAVGTSLGAAALPENHPAVAESRLASTAPSTPAAPSTAVPSPTATGHLDSSRLIESVQPVYPREAKKKHVQGVVVLRLVVDTEGQVRSVDVVTGSPLLAPAAMDAARQFRYSPALLDGKPIETIQTADIYFQLGH